MRAADIGLYVKHRSYLNHAHPAEDPVAVFIPGAEIDWMRKHGLLLAKPDSTGFDTTEAPRFIDRDAREIGLARLSAHRERGGEFGVGGAPGRVRGEAGAVALGYVRLKGPGAITT